MSSPALPGRQDVTIEFFYSGSWHAVTAYNRDPVTVNRGNPDEGGRTPAKATFTLDNRSGTWSTFNPLSPLYGLVGINTPVRITLTNYEFWGEVSSYTPRRTPDFNPSTGRGDAWVEVEASGPLRRMLAGRDPLASPLRARLVDLDPTAYWPLEDATDATSAASAVGGAPLAPYSYSRFTDPAGTPVPAAGAPKFATGNGIPGSAPVPDLAQGGGLTGPVPIPASGTGWRIAFVIVPPRDQSGPVVPVQWQTTVGPWSTYQVQFDSGGIFVSAIRASDGVAGWGRGWSGFTFDGRPHFVEVRGIDSGSNVDVRVYVDGYEVATLDVLNAPSLAGSVGSISSVWVNPLDLRESDPTIASMPQLGHLVVWQPSVAISGHMEAMRGYLGERTLDRLARLGAARGVDVYYGGGGAEGATSADARTMGIQRVAPLADLVAEIVATEGGFLIESRGAVGLVLVLGRALPGRAPGAVLDFAAGHVAALTPVLDDQLVRNDVTATSTTTGAAERRTLDVGPLSTADPPNGAGRYETRVDVNPASDLDLASYAGRALAAGTRPGLRFRSLVVDLVANPDLAGPVSGLDAGDRVQLVNVPADLTPDVVDLAVVGIRDVIGSHSRRIEIIGRPWSTVDAAVVGTFRADSETSTLASTAAAGAPALASWSFTTGIESWGGLNGTAAWDGSGALRFTPNGTSASIEARSPNVPGVTAGGTWAVWARVSVPVDRSVSIAIIFRDAAGAIISTTSVLKTLAANVPTGLAVSGVAPAGTTQAMLSVPMGSTPPASHVLTVYEARMAAAGTLSVTRAAGSARWTLTASDWPFDVRLDSSTGTGGERVAVTSVAGTGATQTFTVMRSVNGVSRSWPIGTRVRLWDTPVVGL